MAKAQVTPYPLRMEQGLRDQLQELADTQGLSLHELINQLLTASIGKPHPIKHIQEDLAEVKKQQAEILKLLQGRKQD